MTNPVQSAAVFIDGNNFYHACVNRESGAGVLREVDYYNIDFMALARKLAGGGRKVVDVRYYVGQLKREANTALYSVQRRMIAGLERDGVECRMGRMEKRPQKDGAAEELGRLLESEKWRGGDWNPPLHLELSRLRRQTVAGSLGAWLDKLPSRGGRLPEELESRLRNICARWRSNAVWKEKAVDVMLAVDMLAMAHRGEYDVAYLLSFDGDYTPAVNEVQKAGRKVFAVSPCYGVELAAVAHQFIRIRRDFFNGLWRARQGGGRRKHR